MVMVNITNSVKRRSKYFNHRPGRGPARGTSTCSSTLVSLASLASTTNTMSSNPTVVAMPEAPSRAALRRARRVCVKAGTSVVANEDGAPSLTRLGAIIEQIGELVASGVEVIFVSSGAVGMGKRLLRTQSRLHMSL